MGYASVSEYHVEKQAGCALGLCDVAMRELARRLPPALDPRRGKFLGILPKNFVAQK
jgi:hypothetical protein